MKYCPVCSSKIAEGTNRCINCGYSGSALKSDLINNPNNNKKEGIRQAIAALLAVLIIFVTILFSFERDPETGGVTLDLIILFLGMILGIMVFMGIVFGGNQNKFFRLRFCVSCGRSIPFDAVICPFCRYDYEKDHKTKGLADHDSLGQDSDVKEKIGG